MLGSLFRKKTTPEPVKEQFPLELYPGAALSFDMMPVRMVADSLLFSPPEGQQIVEAIGVVDLGASARLYRFYTGDDFFLQVSCTGGITASHIDDIKLFSFYDTEHPNGQQQVDQWVGEGGVIGRPQRSFDGKTFDRVWGSGDQWLSPNHLVEKVKPRDDAGYGCDHLCMLYQRNIEGASDITEYTLTSLEFTGDDEYTVVTSVGVDVPMTSIEIF
ncbi:DUF2491 family protein [Parendozoicomonas haliclonae]|uniref:DUF2491 domain-containing protein n=1 Tax=Parendozoicomonas haliclonae TaxID=1960125 RepID=A0A1X7ARI2_9GAMM|nr:DUF2491 family protein [Parendozoicomonas haliclonae]SMA50753.1 hypothetical protein EHSB41UT_04570 [Parendozoicomonas haliclonae]